jgi:hypothetical protein
MKGGCVPRVVKLMAAGSFLRKTPEWLVARRAQ